MTNPSPSGTAASEVALPDDLDSVESFVAAGLGRRLGARCVDTLLRLPLAYLELAAVYIAYHGFIGSGQRNDPPEPAWVAVTCILALVLVVYEPLVVVRWGCTLGKLMFGISVRQQADPAKTPSFGQALVRWAVPVVSGLALLWLSWEALAALLTDDYGGRSGDIFSFFDGGRETPFSDDMFAWVLMNAVFYGVVAGLPFMSGVLCLAGRLRRGDSIGMHDKAAGTVVVLRKAVPAAAAEPIRSSWTRFYRQLDAEIAEQYEADTSVTGHSAARIAIEDDPPPKQPKS
ncbi:RDD family protein [Candidatus Poriferisodalis sp.]|uniref:RDD family protein n=1 Tax=Candidatus Poriferisodalis sp. TaxID=3101277 RepID=UPI003B02DFA4